MTALTLALTLFLAAGGDAPAGGPPVPSLTNEDVVRMVAGGTPEREILAAIRDRPPAFDLSGDMIEELTAAGVTPEVLDAMRSRQVEAASAARLEEREKPGYGALVVTLNARTLRLPTWADENAKARFKLPKENEQRAVQDIAVFLACLSPDHVPDLWRSKSPLGRDMASVRPHQMLVFVAGDTPSGKPPRLTLPQRLEASVDLTEPHDLVLGVAARIGDRWIQVGLGMLPSATMGPQRKPLAGAIEGGGKDFSFKVELKAPR